ncbi:sodium-coupled monocarboxylate transporter 1 [Anabrus simplex]|uniref:sodium-coupled monocarboxylate transporter 1 n=1 Tax=Anabrus simplex TaxID=316456 RepID=UPI0035A33E1D
MFAEEVELELAARRFSGADYAVFALMFVVCTVIGVYYGFFARSFTAEDYLMGGRNMGLFPISLSLIATFLSSTALIGVPTDVYLHGMQYLYSVCGIVLMAVVLTYAYLPVLHHLKLTSTYEYLELRFSRTARLFGSLLFCIKMIVSIPIYLYAPALAFSQVSGASIHLVALFMCIVCVFYTSLGGLKAVVWTDVIQAVTMFAAVILIVVKGTIDNGGLSVVWQRNARSGRIEPPIFDPDPTVTYTFWSSSVGMFCIMLQTHAFNQSMMQRYLSLRHLQAANRAVWMFVAGAVTFLVLSFYCGLLMYATYHDCDPLTTQLVTAKDQVLLLQVMRTLGDFPGLPGIFVAGVFSAALSSLSSALNSTAAVVLEDFYKTFFAKPLSQRQTSLLLKTTVLVTGLVGVSLLFVVEKLGSVLKMALSVGSMPEGPILAVFTLGLFFPWVNSKGILAGGTAGLTFIAWLTSGAYLATTRGQMTKPLSVDGCTYNFSTTSSPLPDDRDVFILYRISYMWYVPLGCLVTMLVALAVSFLSGGNDLHNVKHQLLSPLVRGFLPVKATTAGRNCLVGYKPVELQTVSRSAPASTYHCTTNFQ